MLHFLRNIKIFIGITSIMSEAKVKDMGLPIVLRMTGAKLQDPSKSSHVET